MWPKISIIIPTYNSEEYIKACLESVSKQRYPKDKIEALIVDGGSTDKTKEIASKYPVKIIHNPRRLAEPAKTLGYKYSTGELFFYLDSDAELVSRNWLSSLVNPLLKNLELAGSFTRYYPKKSQSAFNRYLSYSPLQMWSMLSYLLPSLKSVTVWKSREYSVIKINPDRCPPIGLCIYRKSLLKKIIKNPDTFNYVDIAIPIQLAEIGYDKLAYVEKAGIYHQRTSLWHEFKRQKRDIKVTYLPVFGKRKFNYINFRKPKDILKVFFWIIYANLLIPSLIVGIYKTIKYKDIACLYEMPANLFLTDYIIFLFLTDKNSLRIVNKIISKN
jgi:glycosyltransferase involved in cell wall biosynthesis